MLVVANITQNTHKLIQSAFMTNFPLANNRVAFTVEQIEETLSMQLINATDCSGSPGHIRS